MNLPTLRFVCCLTLFILQESAECQVKKKIREYERTFQFSLFPGISTNGIYSGSYFNRYSLNLFGGLSAGNHIIEISPITNVNVKSSTGIHLAGLANIIGANAFINLSMAEEWELIKGDFESNGKGIQVAGLLNYVRNHSSGIQLAGALNVVGGDFKGIQIAGIGNSSGNSTNGFSEGLQLAGLYNISKQSIAGFQLSSFFNYTDGQLSGTQLGLINKARSLPGKYSQPTRARGFQIGLFNFTKEMDGTQIGLVNFGGASLGKQFGVINFYKRSPTTRNTRYNTPVGLINIGSVGSFFRLTYNEIFAANIEYTTGNCLNCSRTQSAMPFDDQNQIYNQNALIVGYSPQNNTWGLGYGFEKILYNKASMLPTNRNNRKRIISYGIRFLHLNRKLEFDRSFNLLNRLHVEYGKRFMGRYVFVGVALNYFLRDREVGADEYKINSLKISTGKFFDLDSDFWPGYSVGIQI
jgi:hypothetical protein